MHESENQQPRVSIVVLNYRSWQDIVECLESLYRINYPSYDVIVVDNGSGEDIIQKIVDWAEGRLPVEAKFFQYTGDGKPVKYLLCTQAEAEQAGPRTNAGNISGMLTIIRNRVNYG